jgi:hypothetical protein
MANELMVQVTQSIGTIECNFEEIKENLAGMMALYEDTVVTEDRVTEAKKDVATLRKIKAAIDDKRKEVKRECLKPYDAFEAKIKQLMELIDKPILLIETQVKEFEDGRREQKKSFIKKAYDELIGDAREYLPLEKIYDTRWENFTFSMTDVRDAIEQLSSSTIMAVNTIKGMNSEYAPKAIEQYKQDLSLPNAITAINRYEQQKAEILAREEAKRKEEEERKRQEAEKTRQREEEERKAAEVKASGEVPFDTTGGPAFGEAPFIPVGSRAFTVAIECRTYTVKATSDKLRQIENYLNEVGADWRML